MWRPIRLPGLPSPQSPSRWQIVRAVLLALFGLLFLIRSGANWLQMHPDMLPDLVDTVRAVAGPQLVAQIETLAFSMQDRINQAHYQLSQATPTIPWASAPIQQTTAESPAQASGIALPAARTNTGIAPLATLVPSVAADISMLPWSPYVVGADGTSLLERTLVTPDPDRPYAQTALVRIDLTRTQLHLVAGTTEPLSVSKAARPGIIPRDLLLAGQVLAAFNGGFKAANGQYGMGSDGITWLPAQPGLATLALYHDGNVRLGVWGQDISASADMIAFRQNCPLLLDHGALTAEADHPTTALWGATVGNKVATWRSGLGISADGRYLLYAVGDGLTVPALAEALRQGGADRAMQLDINGFWTRFVSFSAQAHRLPQAQRLLEYMQGTSQQFVTPDTRDFFYVTRKAM